MEYGVTPPCKRRTDGRERHDPLLFTSRLVWCWYCLLFDVGKKVAFVCLRSLALEGQDWKRKRKRKERRSENVMGQNSDKTHKTQRHQ